ncbi:sugar ABC transporter permease [Cellulomonas sp. zg-ZUI222]|uniref:carbohydrate ABC transporter permease n=1 Tax=Cellulomonas TaxID=1707 RepID=UPI001A94AA29|nr:MULTISPECIES: sugar ABC transporter permease [Cellulomonas]MBO0898537.1 sugar ABC transporter permease [Cellulomonas sp. zg-ZUI22]MBO0919401.1 sugar ABC transporter permease [Cellulomonas wangleii]
MTMTPTRAAGAPGTRRAAVAPAAPRRRPRRPGLEAYVYLAPAIVLVGSFAGYPLARSVWFAFNDVNPFSGVQGFVGVQHFVDIVTDPDFAQIGRNTLVWTFGAVALQLLLGLVGAHLLNARFALRGVYRGLAMIPWATPSVLVALMWIWILDPNHGVLNGALRGLGVTDRPIAFLSESSTALPTLVAVDVWQGVPLFAVMILAALQGVAPELREAAAMDGCGPVGVFRHVVLPAILPTILITTLLRLIWTANYVDLVLIMTGGGPGLSSTTLSLQSYVTAYKAMDFGGGAAYAVLQAAVLSVLVVLYIRLTAKGARR